MQKNDENYNNVIEEPVLHTQESDIQFSAEENIDDDIESEEFAPTESHTYTDLQIEEQSKDGRFKRVLDLINIV